MGSRRLRQAQPPCLSSLLRVASTSSATRMVHEIKWLSLSKSRSSNGNISVAELVEAAGVPVISEDREAAPSAIFCTLWHSCEGCHQGKCNRVLCHLFPTMPSTRRQIQFQAQIPHTYGVVHLRFHKPTSYSIVRCWAWGK